MTKEEYIKDQIASSIQYWIGIIYLLGAFLFLLLGIMDYFVTSEYFQKFVFLRICIASTLIVFYILNKKRDPKLQYLLIVLGTLFSALTIEIMILYLGGHKSHYYAGMNLLALCVLGIVPFYSLMTIIFILIVYLTYLVPIFLFDKITDLSVFIANNAFLLSTFVILFVWRALSQKRLINELALQYELDSDKQKLARYSTDLERVVDERTRELNKSEVLLRTLYDNANDGIMIIDRFGNIARANKRACEIHGFEEGSLTGLNIKLLETQENVPLYEKRMRRIIGGEPLVFETEHYRKDGSKVLLEVSSRALEIDGEIFIQSFQRDITERRRLQSQLLQSQKLESIGTLAGGIAHDFNNVLNAILGYAELILMDEDIDSRVADKAKSIEKSARSASSMVSKLLSFARRGEPEIMCFDLNMVIDDTMGMLSRMIPKNITLKRKLHKSLPIVGGDVSQIEQVLMNLVINAKDAMPDGGALTIKTDVVEIDPYGLVNPNLTPGKYVALGVSDTGVGIPQEHLPHIFEPFFTTKERGKGTGLGLAMAYGIARDHNGDIVVESQEGKGSTFTVYLPVSKKGPIGVGKEETVRYEGGGGSILVIDDEVSVLKLIKEALEKNKFHVVVTDDPQLGIEIFKENKEIELVITDMVMPKMGGEQVIKSIREIRPDAKIIVISGYTEDVGDASINGFLKKPFHIGRLLSTVRGVLDHRV